MFEFGQDTFGYARFDSLAQLTGKFCCCFSRKPETLERACHWVAGLETLSALLSIAGALGMVAFRMEVQPVYSSCGILYAGILLPLVALMLSGVRQQCSRRMYYYLIFKYITAPILFILTIVFAFVAPHLQHQYHMSHPNAENKSFDLSWDRFYKFYPAFLTLLIIYCVCSIWYMYVVCCYRGHCVQRERVVAENKTNNNNGENFNGVTMNNDSHTDQQNMTY